MQPIQFHSASVPGGRAAPAPAPAAADPPPRSFGQVLDGTAGGGARPESNRAPGREGRTAATTDDGSTVSADRSAEVALPPTAEPPRPGPPGATATGGAPAATDRTGPGGRRGGHPGGRSSLGSAAASGSGAEGAGSPTAATDRADAGARAARGSGEPRIATANTGQAPPAKMSPDPPANAPRQPAGAAEGEWAAPASKAGQPATPGAPGMASADATAGAPGPPRDDGRRTAPGDDPPTKGPDARRGDHAAGRGQFPDAVLDAARAGSDGAPGRAVPQDSTPAATAPPAPARATRPGPAPSANPAAPAPEGPEPSTPGRTVPPADGRGPDRSPPAADAAPTDLVDPVRAAAEGRAGDAPRIDGPVAAPAETPGPRAPGSSPATHPAAPAASQATAMLAQVAREAGSQPPGTPLELTLDPPELGRVRLVVQAGDAGPMLQIAADRAETLELMRRHADQLSAQLREHGLHDTGFSFARTPGRGNGAAARPADDAVPPAAAAAPPPIDRARVAPGALDLRL